MSASLPTNPVFFQTEQVFHSGYLDNTADDTGIETVELVRKGSPLVKLQPGKATSDDDKSARLASGTFTLLSDDKKTLIADADGYPHVSQKTEKEQLVVTVSLIPLLSISDDEMEAHITLYPTVPSIPDLESDVLLSILHENNIRFGLNQTQLQDLLRRCHTDRVVLTGETVARGLLPLHGKDSFLRFHIETGPLPGKILGNGKIDFRERKMFVGVKKQEIIATRIPSTSGSPGITVLATKIPQREGKQLPVSVSGDVEFDEKNGVIRATESGILSMVHANAITVCAKQVIPGDVDYSTGNIESRDAVEIQGSILPGFKVSTRGDLSVGGSIRSAFIRCRGNLIVQDGIMGDNGNIRVKGDVDFKFIEQGKLWCDGKAIIRKQAYYSKILATDDIFGHESSTVIGGMLLSGKSISLGTVGSPNAPPALLAAGITPGRYLEYLKIRDHLHEQEEALHIWLQRHGQRAVDPGRESLESTISELKRTIQVLNLTPPAAGDSPEAVSQYLGGITITIHSIIHAGTRIQIGQAVFECTADLRAVRFHLNREGDTIVESPL